MILETIEVGGCRSYIIGCPRTLVAAVIDQDGKIHWSYVSPLGVNPGADGILEPLESLPQQEQLKAGRKTQ